MTHGHNPKKPPLPSFFSRLTEWSGWEYLYEERRKVLLVVLLVIGFVLGLGWIISRKQSSSLGKIIQAEALVTTITDPSSEETDATVQKAVDTLFSLSKDPLVLSRFCDVLTQEEILTKKKDLTPDFCDATSLQLSQQNCPVLSSLMELTLLQRKGSWQQALSKVDEMKEQFHTPWLSLYLLIQKAHILGELGQSTHQVIEELRSAAGQIESVDEFFETWFQATANDFFNSLEKK